MEEHRSGQRSSYRPRLTPVGKKPGELSVKFPPRRVFVTGGASGIGKAIVKAFCDAGCRVAFCDINAKDGAATAQSCGARFYPADVADVAALDRCLDDLFYLWGDIDVIVNNAGVSRFKPLVETTPDEFDALMAVNVRPVFVTSRRLALHRRSLTVPNPYGRIINIASTRALMSESDTEPYSASKGAVVALTHSLMATFAGSGVTVNSISPGWIETGDRSVLSDADNALHPSGRVGAPEDVARICLFLVLPGNEFINGENIVVDGGMTRKMIY